MRAENISNLRRMKKLLTLFLSVLCASLSAQDDVLASVAESVGDESRQAVLYDAFCQFDTTDFSETIFLYNAVTGVPTGEMVYKNGSYYMERNGVRTKLTRGDLLQMFSSEQFRDYTKAKGKWNASIPLFAVGGCACALAVTGAGLWIYNWIHATVGIYQNDPGKLTLRPATIGFACMIAGMAVATATLIPAFNLHGKGNSMMSSLAYDYNYSRNYEDNNSAPNSGKRPASNTSMRISIGGASQGFGLALHF